MRGTAIILNIISIKNTGLYSWKIPSSLRSGTDYYISVNATDNSAGTISQTFTIKPKLKSVPSYDIKIFLISIIIGVGLVWKKRIIKTKLNN